MENKEAIRLIEWLQETPTAKQFYGISAEELLRYYKEQNSPLSKEDVSKSSLYCVTKRHTKANVVQLNIETLEPLSDEFFDALRNLLSAYCG